MAPPNRRTAEGVNEAEVDVGPKLLAELRAFAAATGGCRPPRTRYVTGSLGSRVSNFLRQRHSHSPVNAACAAEMKDVLAPLKRVWGRTMNLWGRALNLPDRQVSTWNDGRWVSPAFAEIELLRTSAIRLRAAARRSPCRAAAAKRKRPAAAVRKRLLRKQPVRKRLACKQPASAAGDRPAASAAGSRPATKACHKKKRPAAAAGDRQFL